MKDERNEVAIEGAMEVLRELLEHGVRWSEMGFFVQGRVMKFEEIAMYMLLYRKSVKAMVEDFLNGRWIEVPNEKKK